MKNECLPRILIVDNSPPLTEELRQTLELYHYTVETVLGPIDGLIERAITVAKTFRPHVAIIDLRVLGPVRTDNDRSEDEGGLKIAQELAVYTKCILYSGFLGPDVDRRAKELGVYSWVRKGDPARLLELIAEAAKEMCACRNGFKLSWPSSWDAKRVIQNLIEEENSIPPDDVVPDIMGRLFRGSKQVGLSTLEETVVSPGSQIRSRSVVFKAWPANKRQPHVVKLAQSSRISKEWRNYIDHIKGNLGGAFYPIVPEQPVLFWDLAAILYTFVGAPQQGIYRFSDFYLHQEPAALFLPLRHFFVEVWGELYRDTSELLHPLFRSYDKAFGLRNRLQRFSNKEDLRSFPGIALLLPNPVMWVLRHEADSFVPHTFQAVTHGDLHCDNIFVDKSHAWAINFDRTGLGPILRDFAELEVDIITRLINFSPDDLGLFFLLTIAIVRPATPGDLPPLAPEIERNPQTAKALACIRELRFIMHQVTRYTDPREYLWGLLLDALFVASSVPESAPQRNRALLLAAVVCKRLETWNQEWPPPDWPQVNARSVSSTAGVQQLATPHLRTNGCEAMLTYNRRDHDLVEIFAEYLDLNTNLNIWFDRVEVTPGDTWQLKLEGALEGCNSCLVCWGPSGLGPWQHEELRTALERRVRDSQYRVIGVLLPGCRDPKEMPAFLRNLNYADFRRGIQNPEELRRLVRAIRSQSTTESR